MQQILNQPYLKQVTELLKLEAEAIARAVLQFDSATQVKSFISDSPLFKGG